MRILATTALLLLTAVCRIAAAEQKDFQLHDGDRVVFYGDSITDQRLYTTFTETYAVTRFPDRKIKFVHSGWGGDRVSGGGGGPIDLRLERDVFAYKPTVMTIMLGMNDGAYRAFDQNIFDTYSKGYEHIIESVKKNAHNPRITVIGPSPYDDVTREIKIADGYNKVMVRFADFVKELAGREHMNYADLNTAVVASLEKAKAADPDTAKKIIPDFVHPGPSGHLLMAGALLKAWDAPAVVSTVEIDANEKKAKVTDNTKVSNLSVERAIKWTQHDKALPMPVDLNDPVMKLAVKSSDFMESLNQETLRVSGLPQGNYKLRIDDADVATFSGEDLGKGVNLALYKTPMTQQASTVHALTLKHNDVHFTRWRNIEVKLDKNTEGLQRALADLDEVEESIVKQQRKAAEPAAHKFELNPE